MIDYGAFRGTARRWLPVAAIFGCVAVAGCDARQLTAPEASAPIGGPLLSGGSGSSVLGAGFLSPPATSSPAEVAALSLVPLATAGQATWVVVNVQGQIKTSRNPACDAYEPSYWKCHDSPMTTPFGTEPWDGGPVRVQTVSDVYGVHWMRLRGTGGDESAMGLAYLTAGSTVSAKLNLNAAWAWNPMTGAGPPSYFVSGGYSVTVTQVESPLRLTASAPDDAGESEYSLEVLHGLAFLNPLGWWWHWPPGAVRWYFQWDSGHVRDIPACTFQTTCRYKSPGPGKVQATAYVEGWHVTINAAAREVPELKLTCPETVMRGETMTCTVAAHPSGTLTDIRWSFVDAAGHSQSEAGTYEWGGRLVISGRMSVSAVLDEAPVSASAAITVEARAWEGRIPYPSSLPREEIDPARFPPIAVIVEPNGYDRWIPGALGLYEWWLDWRGKFQPIGSGPNKDYWYLKDPPIWAPPVVYLSGHLEPGHPLYEAQTGRRSGDRPPPRGYTGWCTKANMDALRQEVREHEGSASGLRLSHHAFNVQYTSQNDPGPAVEAVILRPASTDRFVDIAESALGAAYGDALKAANNATVHAAGNLYTVPCKAHLP